MTPAEPASIYNPRPSALRAMRALNLAGWAVLALTAVFMFGYALPHKGGNYGDEGWYLYSALMAAEGTTLDTIIPQAPAYLINAVFMKLGITSYLSIRYADATITAAAIFVFLSGLRRGGGGLGIAAFGSALGLLTEFNSVIGYHKAPVLFALFALGSYFHAMNAGRPAFRQGAAVLSGFFLAVSCLANFTTIPAATFLLFACGYAFPVRRDVFKWTMFSAFVFFAIVAGLYIYSIGVSEFFRSPESHGVNTGRIILGLKYILFWPMVWGLMFAIASALARGATETSAFRFRRGAALILAPVTAATGALLVTDYSYGSDLFSSAFPFDPLYDWLRAYWLRLSPYGHITKTVGALGWSLFGLAVVFGFRRTHTYRRILLSGVVVAVYYMNLMFFTLMDVDMASIFIAGPSLALAFYAFHYFFVENSDTPLAGMASLAVTAVFALAACGLYTYNYSHPYSGSISANSEKIANGPLAGLYEKPYKADMLRRLEESYTQYRCSDAKLVTFSCTPLLHYMFDAEAAPGLAHVWPTFRYPEKKIFSTIESAHRWCVYLSQNNETDDGWKKTLPLTKYLEDNSSVVKKLYDGTRRHPHDDFVLYIGPKDAKPERPGAPME